MRILHVGWGYPPEWMGCGPVVYVHNLALSQAQAGDKPMVVCASDRSVPGRPLFDPAVNGIDGIPYIHLQNRPSHMHDKWNPGREAFDPTCAAAFEHVLKETSPEVVHIHNLVGLSFDIIGAAKRYGARLVASLHNYFPICSRDDLFFADAERCDGPLERSCSNCLGTVLGDEHYRERHRVAVEALNTCDVLLAVSGRVADIYAAQGIDRRLLTVDRIGSVAAVELWREVGGARVPSPAPVGGPLRLVFFGTLTPRKGIVSFLQALRLVEHPERVEAHVHGSAAPDLVEPINALIRTFSPGHASRLTFHGAFSQADLPAVLAAADVAVLPPRWDDNGPQTVFEALAAGLPVIGTRVGGIPDIVENGRNGLLVDDGDPRQLAAAIDRLAHDPALVARLRRGINPPLSMDDHRVTLEGYYRAPVS
ncbi:MAG TPA: glycosyltransferase [Acidimicrobiales bacterium]|nr:glycosyltransferase [Acidimicrobiales bacterium]